MVFEMGCKVRVVPKSRFGWNSEGLMEKTVGRIGTVIHCRGDSHDVVFSGYEHPFGTGAWWTYHKDDLVRAPAFKGNK